MSSEQKKYTDVGMLIPGAPKLRAKAMVDALDFTGLAENIADSLGVPISDISRITYDHEDERDHHLLDEWQQGLSKDKLWPAPAYGKLIEDGVPAQAVAFIKSLRDAIPRHAHRPTPGTLEALSDLIAKAREYADQYQEHWLKVASQLRSSGPSYGRIAQVAALAADVSAQIADKKRNEPLYPVSLAPPLTDEEQQAIRAGVFEEPAFTPTLTTLIELFQDYRSADHALGRTYRHGGHCPARQSFQAIEKTTRALRSISFNVHKGSTLEILSGLRRQIRIKASVAPPAENGVSIPDREIGHHLPILKIMKIKPHTLPGPLPPGSDPNLVEEDKTPKKTKPRRPERLTTAEAKELLRSPEDDGEDEAKHQDLNALIEMGMVRGIQWGEWVPQKERATLVKNIFESFENFATGMQITPSLVGLGNPVSAEQRDKLREDGLYESDFSGKESLGLAMGARGKSSAAAHYEPGLHAINLTRFNGAGALAHEIFHGLDFKLTQMLDLEAINRNYSAADVRKTTASRRGVTTFSELIGHYWWMKTYQTDRNEANVNPPHTYKQENQRLITKFLKYDVRSDEKATKEIMPLMVGLAEFVREMYHRPREPEDMLAEAVSATAQTLMASQRYQGTNPLVAAAEEASPPHETNRGLRSIIDCLPTLNDSTDEALSNDVAMIARLSSEAFRQPDSDISDTLENWDTSSYVPTIERISYRISQRAVAKLESLLDRDLDKSDSIAIAAYISDQVEMNGLQAMIQEVAIRKIINLNSPPRQYSSDDTVQDNLNKEVLSGQLKASIEEVLENAPHSFLDRMEGLSIRVKNARINFNNTLSDLDPTPEGKMAGLKKVDVSSDSRTRAWAEATKSLANITHRVTQRKSFASLHVLRTICDARKNPPQRNLTEPSGHLLENFEHLRDCMNSAISGEDFTGDRNLTQVLERITDSPEGVPNPEMLRKLATDGISESKLAGMGKWERRDILVALSVEAYSSSSSNDGKMATFARAMRDPALLDGETPPGIVQFCKYIGLNDFNLEERDTDGDWSDPKTLRSFYEKFFGRALDRIVPYSAFNNDQLRADYHPPHRPNSDIQTCFTYIIRDAIKNGTFQGIEALDSAIDNVGTSFRYLPGDEKVDIISSFYGEQAAQMREKLSPDCFKEQLYNDMSLHHRDVRDNLDAKEGPDAALESRAAILIAGSQDIESQSRRSKTFSHFTKDLNTAKNALHQIPISQRVPSDTLLHSATYDGAQVETAKFGIFPGSKKGYWYSAVEMFARCAETALHDTLQEKGISSPYLVTVPNAAAQDQILKTIPPGTYPGITPALNMPAGKERAELAATFQREVIPHAEQALNAMFPDAKPAYEAYLEKQQSLGERKAMLTRIDSEPDERMLAQDEMEQPDKTLSPRDPERSPEEAAAPENPGREDKASAQEPAPDGDEEYQPVPLSPSLKLF